VEDASKAHEFKRFVEDAAHIPLVFTINSAINFVIEAWHRCPQFAGTFYPQLAMAMQRYQAQRYAEIFPRMNDESFAELVEDIGCNGPRSPIIFYQGKILVGKSTRFANNLMREIKFAVERKAARSKGGKT